MGSCCSQEGRNENVDGGKGKPNDVVLDKEPTVEEQMRSPCVPNAECNEEEEHTGAQKGIEQPTSARKQDGMQSQSEEEQVFAKEVLNVRSPKAEINVASCSKGRILPTSAMPSAMSRTQPMA